MVGPCRWPLAAVGRLGYLSSPFLATMKGGALHPMPRIKEILITLLVSSLVGSCRFSTEPKEKAAHLWDTQVDQETWLPPHSEQNHEVIKPACPDGCARGLDCVDRACRCIKGGSCNGCCDENGRCQLGTNWRYCGKGGVKCSRCISSNCGDYGRCGYVKGCVGCCKNGSCTTVVSTDTCGSLGAACKKCEGGVDCVGVGLHGECVCVKVGSRYCAIWTWFRGAGIH